MSILRLDLAWLSVLAAVVAGLLASAQVLTTEDLGYHLDYGGRFLESGRPVDHDELLYTLPAADTPPDQRPEPGPGCWYDDDGRYRFANANWLSQVMMAAAFRVGGVGALNVQLVLLVAALLGLIVVLMHRLEVPPAAIGAAVLAFVLVSYPRLTLRPELFGYIVLAAQACLLAGIWRSGRFHGPLSWAVVAGLIGLQWLFVNLHSYFLLGLALTGAVLVGSLGDRDVPTQSRRRHLLRLAVAAGGQAVVCLVNPWTWRLAVLPVQTVRFLRSHDIADGPAAHPWTSMGDMQRVVLFGDGWATDVVALSFLACLAAIVAGIVAALMRRRWDWLLLIAGMTLVSFSAQRNMAVGMLAAVPFALAAVALAPWWPAARAWCVDRAPVVMHGRVTGPGVARFGAGAVLAAAVVTGSSIVTNRLYILQDSPIRFGAGLSHLHLPIGAARWISEHEVEGRIWTSPLCSSTIRGFVDPSPPLNMVTNTWAYPPAVMQQVLTATSSYGPQPFSPVADRYGVSVVVARSGLFLRQVVGEGRWVPVHAEGRFVVLVLRDGPDGHLARRYALSPETADTATLIRNARRLDPVPGLALWLVGRVLVDLGWHDHAVEMLAASLRANPSQPRAWIATANALTGRAVHRHTAGHPGAQADLEQTVDALERAWSLSGDPDLLSSITVAEQRLATLRQAMAVADGMRP